MIQDAQDNLDVNQRVGVVQAHNEKGESCGRIILAGELDEDVREKLRMFDALKEFARNYVAFSVGNADHLNWPIPEIKLRELSQEEIDEFKKLMEAHIHDPQAKIIMTDKREIAGVCPWCDYGGSQGLKEHEHRCELRRVVEWFDKTDPVIPKETSEKPRTN